MANLLKGYKHMENRTVYQVINQHKNTVSKLYSDRVSYADIARQLSIESGRRIDPRRVGEYVRENLKSNENIIIKYTRGSDVSQIKNHYSKAVESVPKIRRPQVTKPKNDKQFNVLVLSDLHIGQQVKASDVDGLNEYNEEVVVRRLGNILDQVSQSRG